MAMLKLGYKASAEQFTPAQLLEFGELAEEMGFDSCFISDHFQPWKHTDGHAPNSLVWLGALGARTRRMVIGTSVLTPTFRYHPSIVAQAFGTLGSMFPGRVILGIGTGEGLNEVPSTGQPWPEFKERFARMREAVQLMRKLWTEERVSFEGQYYRTEHATIYDRPETPVPIYVAAAGAMVAKYAGRAGDGFICTSGKKPELYTETLLPNVVAGLEAALLAYAKDYDDNRGKSVWDGGAIARRALAARPTTETRVVTDADIAGAVARGWCYEGNTAKAMDPDLANAILFEIRAIIGGQANE
jgi:coenzyme F420-dependent glucose-6-phosphate dehydrogenase